MHNLCTRVKLPSYLFCKDSLFNYMPNVSYHGNMPGVTSVTKVFEDGNKDLMAPLLSLAKIIACESG